MECGVVFCLLLEQLGLELSHCLKRKSHRVLREKSCELCVCVCVCVCVMGGGDNGVWQWVATNNYNLLSPRQGGIHPPGSCCSA